MAFIMMLLRRCARRHDLPPLPPLRMRHATPLASDRCRHAISCLFRCDFTRCDAMPCRQRYSAKIYVPRCAATRCALRCRNDACAARRDAAAAEPPLLVLHAAKRRLLRSAARGSCCGAPCRRHAIAADGEPLICRLMPPLVARVCCRFAIHTCQRMPPTLAATPRHFLAHLLPFAAAAAPSRRCRLPAARLLTPRRLALPLSPPRHAASPPLCCQIIFRRADFVSMPRHARIFALRALAPLFFAKIFAFRRRFRHAAAISFAFSAFADAHADNVFAAAISSWLVAASYFVTPPRLMPPSIARLLPRFFQSRPSLPFQRLMALSMPPA